MGAALAAAAFARADTTAPSSLATSGLNSRWLSGGLYSALASQGVFGAQPTPARARAGGVADLSKGKPRAVLDARVGVNVRLGDDPAALPATQRGQAEPHLARSAANPDVLLATYQEGRFADGGALDCGYALSRDGGISWTRALIPQLTTASGGIYQRATDPVAAIGPQGDLYLCTLASVDNAFGIGAIVVSRSFDNTNWTTPSVAYQSPDSQTMADKEWLAVNDFPGTPNSARLVVTWTNFTFATNGRTTGNNLLAAVSDDRGTTWSAPVAITPAGSLNQGTLPIFLPDGSLAVIYITFANANTETLFSIQCKRSLDGGRTFPGAATTAVTFVNGYADPALRSGVFLPSATVARTTGELFVTYVSVFDGTPRVMITKSADQGATWTTPVIASDNPTGSAVANPAVAVTPDGKTIAVAFIDKRLTPIDSTGHNFFIDHFAAMSFDGGANWQPNLRLSEMTSDIRYATHTSEGYMLGDYLGIAPPANDQTSFGQNFVPIWCDTRTGDADPFIVRIASRAVADFQAWGIARTVPLLPFDADADSDGVSNAVEYLAGTDPRRPESGEMFVIRHVDAETIDALWTQRASVDFTIGDQSLYTVQALLSVVDELTYHLGGIRSGGSISAAALTNDQLPTVAPPAGLVWHGMRFKIPANAARAVAFAVKVSNGLDPVRCSELAAFNTDSRLINLSTRGPIRPGGGPMIAGFVVRGTASSLLIRGVGPSLANFGIADFAGDPALTLTTTRDSTFRAQNDTWTSGGHATLTFIFDASQRAGAFPLLSDSSTKEAVLLEGGLAPGDYSAQLNNLATTGGSTGLVEVYDASVTSDAQLVNLSTRGEIGPPDGALIAGFVIRGTQPRRVLLRAVGPSLAQFNVPGVVADPLLTLCQGNTIIATNDDWEISRSSAAIAATAVNVGAFALNPASLDSALLITLQPGAYTAVVSGVNGATGTALIEVYGAN